MSRELKELFDRNRAWAQKLKAQSPDYFEELAAEQTPEYLWIGCSDSRVPCNMVLDLPPGHLFVHRNIANVVVHTDFNCLSVIEFAVEVLKVKHIVVCGHHGCGGIRAALGNSQNGLIDNWLRHIKDVYTKHERMLSRVQDEQKRFDRLSELNVIEQVNNVCHTTIVQNAWKSGRELAVHGWVYDIKQGLLKDLSTTISSNEEIQAIYRIMDQAEKSDY